MRVVHILLLVGVVLMSASSTRQAGADNPPPASERAACAALPNPLTTRDGTKIATAESWRAKGRPEVERLFAHYMYGYAPPAPENVRGEVARLDRAYFGGKATLKQVTIRYGPEAAPPIHLLLVVPNRPQAPSPVFLGLNFGGNHSVLADPEVPLSDAWLPARYKGVVENRATEAARGTMASRWPFKLAVDRGYGIATFYHGDVDPDRDDFSDGIHPHYYWPGQTAPGPHQWAGLAAWAWGLSRAVDYLATDPDVDRDRIAVMGHSRNGKTALLAGSRDERIGLVVSNQSGCGGAALSRRRVGETVQKINRGFPHWFNATFKGFDEREDQLPFDQHMLIALIAPRPVLVCSAVGDAWADPEGEFLALKGAGPLYRLLGTDGLRAETRPAPNHLVDSTLGYHIRPGKHGVGAEDWTVFLDFADEQWNRGKR